MILTETPRLIIRRFNHADASFLNELLNTEGWKRFIGERNVRTDEDAVKYMDEKFVPGYEGNGYSAYVIEMKENNQPIGMSSLIKRDYLDYPDVGYALLPGYNSKGYALEATMALINYAKTVLQLTTLHAIVNHDNERSISLLQKLGFQYDRKIEDQEENILVYSLTG